MGILDQVKSLFQSKKLDVTARFELEKQAFTGTMSKFRVAREIETGQRLGIKFIDVEKSKDFEARFKGLKKPSEGEIGMQIKHDRVVETIEFGMTTTNLPYILMEYIDGPGLSTSIQNQEGGLVEPRLRLIREMAEAIEAVHAAGFIHRDICPRNFICDADLAHVKLIDFGLTVPDTAPFKQPGNRTGTPLYMAPEIVRRRTTDKRVDIFALGVTAYRLLTWKHPWPGEDTSGKAALAHDTMDPIPILKWRPELNKTLATTVMDSISANADKRPESAKRFAQLIRNVKQETE